MSDKGDIELKLVKDSDTSDISATPATSNKTVREYLSGIWGWKTVLLLLYFTMGVGITLYALVAKEGYTLTFSTDNAVRIVLLFFSISAMKFVGIVGFCGYIFTIGRNFQRGVFNFIFGFYTVLLCVSLVNIVGVLR